MGAGWDRGMWALWLAPYLVGEAEKAYMALSAKQGKDYEAIKVAIPDRVGSSTEKYQQKQHFFPFPELGKRRWK